MQNVTCGGTHRVADVGGRRCHRVVQHVHLLQLHVAVQLLQLRRLHTLQLGEVVLGEAVELGVHVVRVVVPVMVCRRRQSAGVLASPHPPRPNHLHFLQKGAHRGSWLEARWDPGGSPCPVPDRLWSSNLPVAPWGPQACIQAPLDPLALDWQHLGD